MSLIVANIALLFLWLWIIAMILPIFRWKRSIIITSLIGAIIGASTLRVTPHVIDGAFTASAQIAQGVTWSIILILSIISLSINPKQRKPLTQTTIIVGLVAIIGQLLITVLPDQIQVLVQFFFCVALIEERIKYAIAQHSTGKRSIHATDIVLFGIMAALSYAWRENILIATHINDIIARTPTYLIHSIFTTVFVIGVYLTTQGRSRWILISTVITALALHTGYNIAGGHLHRSIRAITILTWYGILTYLLSQTDSIYLLRRDTLANT